MLSSDELVEQASFNRTFRSTGWIADPEEWDHTTIIDAQLLPTQTINLTSRLGFTAEFTPDEGGPLLNVYVPRPPPSPAKPRTAVGSYRGAISLLPLPRTSPRKASPRRSTYTRKEEPNRPSEAAARGGKRETPLGHVAMGHNGMMDLGKGKVPTKLAMGDGRPHA